MNTTDADIAGMKEELSQAVYLIGKYLNETPLGNQPHMIAQPAQQWLEQRRKRSLVERVDSEPVVMNTPRYSPAPGTFFKVEEIAKWIQYCVSINRTPLMMLKHIAHGIAATTARHRKEQG